jgi:hypothetical protein
VLIVVSEPTLREFERPSTYAGDSQALLNAAKDGHRTTSWTPAEPVPWSFCAWQVAGIGRHVSDLAFLGVRPTPVGGTVPQALIDAYLDRGPCERHTLQRALLAAELAVFLLLDLLQVRLGASLAQHLGAGPLRPRRQRHAERRAALVEPPRSPPGPARHE